MAQHIRDVLNRRTDLSTFVVHLTKARDGATALEALDSILMTRRLRAETPMGWAKEQDGADDTEQSQRVVCFSEAPLEHIYSLVAEIEGRSVKLEPYGVAFTKMVARRNGINPIWYVDESRGREWFVAKALDQLRAEAIATGNFHEQPFATIAPFLEWMGTWLTTQKEFWWEREWRHVGDVSIPWGAVIWLCPENEIDDLTDHAGDPLRDREPVIDPRWGLEQIIAHLAGFKSYDITPFEVR